MPLDLEGDLRALLNGRQPVLAVGSNASPKQLDRKFAQSGAANDSEAFVPIVPGTVDDLDVVYAAWVSSYGAVPATVMRSNGSTAARFHQLVDATATGAHGPDRGCPLPARQRWEA